MHVWRCAAIEPLSYCYRKAGEGVEGTGHDVAWVGRSYTAAGRYYSSELARGPG